MSGAINNSIILAAVFLVLLGGHATSLSRFNSYDSFVAGKLDEGALFGSTVAASGTEMAIGTRGTLEEDLVFLYDYEAGSKRWDVRQLVAVPRVNSKQGAEDMRVALKGNTLVVGLPRFGSNSTLFFAGGVRVFSRGADDGATFGEGVSLDVGMVQDHNDRVGAAVVLSGDELRLAVSAPGVNVVGRGAVLVFERATTAESFTLLQRIDSPVSVLANAFGRSIDLLGDLLVVGDPHFTVASSAVGRAHLFALANGTFVETATLTAPEIDGVEVLGMGAAVGLGGRPREDFTSDAAAVDVLLVSAPRTDAFDVPAAGAVLVYAVDAEGAAQLVETVFDNAPSSSGFFGTSVEVDGLDVVVASSQASDEFGGAGKVSYFVRPLEAVTADAGAVLDLVAVVRPPLDGDSDVQDGVLFGAEMAMIPRGVGPALPNQRFLFNQTAARTIAVAAPSKEVDGEYPGVVYLMADFEPEESFPLWLALLLAFASLCVVLCVCAVCCCTLVLCGALLVLPAAGSATTGVVATGGATAAVAGVLVASRRYGATSVVVGADAVEMLQMDGEAHAVKELAVGEVELGAKLGEGAYGVVYHGRWRNADVAVKKLTSLVVTPAVLREFWDEAEVMERVGHHPNVCSLVGVVADGETMMIVSEMYANGSLMDYVVSSDRKFKRVAMVRMLRDAAAGVVQLHAEGIVHRDLAARNFLVGKGRRVAVADFGMSRLLAQEAADGASSASTTATTVGPIRWMAPEMLALQQYSRMSDCWMFGATVVEVWSRKRPFGDLQLFDVLGAVVEEGQHCPVPDDLDEGLRAVVEGVLLHEPEQRLSMEEVLALLEARVEALGGKSPTAEGSQRV